MSDFLPSETLWTWLRAAVAEPAVGWSLGSFGAIAEFTRDPDEAVRLSLDGPELVAATARGGVRLRPDPAVRALAYSTAGTRAPAVALCLPAAACTGNGITAVTEIGPDSEALDDGDRGGILFDLGLNLRQAAACVRASDAAMAERLRAGIGRGMFDPASPLSAAWPDLSPHRIFTCSFARIEVKQPIPRPDGRSPDGPHTHVLPKLIGTGRTHAANVPVPDGWIPCVSLFPPCFPG